jgi:hypothetical protein
MAIEANDFISPDETFHSPAALAKRLGLHVVTIIKYFENRPGVLRIGTEGSRYRRRRLTLRISESAVQSFLRERMVKAPRGGKAA